MSKKTIEVLRQLPMIFKYADVSKFVSYPNVFLTRAIKAGYIERIMRGVYYNTFKRAPSYEEIACALRVPSYISCEWALNYHNLLLQVPTVCTVITLSSSVGKRNRVSYKGIIIEYSKIKEDLFFGYETHKSFNMAIPEKALLDTVYLRNRIPFPDEIELENINLDILHEMLQPFPETVKKKLSKFIKILL